MLTWEQAVRSLREDAASESLVRECYFDLPVRAAAERYAASEEFARVQRVLLPWQKGRLLDVGAGNGIASWALARAGFRVIALEPDPSEEVGAGAIRKLEEPGIESVETSSSVPMPVADRSMDVVFCRQVLHHLPDLKASAADMARVLRPGGGVLAIREHVADNERQLEEFRISHPLHRLYGGENAYPFDKYVEAFRLAGFNLADYWSPTESVLNHYPGRESERLEFVRGMAAARFGGLGRLLSWHEGFQRAAARQHDSFRRLSGRLFSFLFLKS